jgi:hypothetical protein
MPIPKEFLQMHFVVIGTDHRLQLNDPGLEGLLERWCDQRFLEPLSAIAEEFHSNIGTESVGMRLAKKRSIRWFQIDMTTDERLAAGIAEAQHSRPSMFQDGVCCRIPSDLIREEFWVRKLTDGALGTTLVICGYLHYAALVERLRVLGHPVDSRVYLEVVPSIEFFTPE